MQKGTARAIQALEELLESAVLTMSTKEQVKALIEKLENESAAESDPWLDSVAS